MVEAEWQASRDTAPVYDAAEVERIKAFFTPPPYESLQRSRTSLSGKPTEFRNWYQRNTKRHKVPGYRAVFVSLKSPARPPGDITDAEMDRVADLADQYSLGLIRSTHDQNLLFADVRQRDLFEVWQALKRIDLATPNIGTLTDMICCPGLDFCSLANATLDSDREADQRALRRSRLPVRPGRHRAEDVRLHERLRPSSRRPHRHSRRR